MKRPLLYVSGPISNGGSLNIWQQKEHVRFSTEISFELIRRGYSVYCPHWSLLAEELIHDKLPHNKWIENDLPWVAKSDAVYRLPGESVGAELECGMARTCEIPIFRDFIAMDGYFRAKRMLP